MPNASATLYSVSPAAYRLYDRLRRRIRPQFESDIQKHERERQQADYLLLSLTNCGRTWLRVILGRAMQLHYGQSSEFEGINLHDLFRFSEINPTLPSIKPMHEKYGQFSNRYQGQKVILLTRDPRDAIVSRYHQHQAEIAAESLEQYVLEDDDFAAYIQFYNDWHSHRDSAADFLVVRYEDMKANVSGEVSRVFEFLGLPITPDEMSQAIDYASFKNMRKMELEGSEQVRTGVMSARDVSDPTSFKVRKGAIGGYKAELSEGAIAHLNAQVKADLHPSYGYQ